MMKKMMMMTPPTWPLREGSQTENPFLLRRHRLHSDVCREQTNMDAEL